MDLMEIVNSLNFSNIAWQIITPLLFNLGDIVTGYIKAVITNSVSSSVMRQGLLHKCAMTLCLLLGFILQFAFGLTIVSKVIAIYIIIMEIVSIYENLKDMGIKFIDIKNLFKKGE